MPKAQAYNVTMYIMAALLVVGFFCNLMIKAVDERHHMAHETWTKRSAWHEGMTMADNDGGGTTGLQLALAWGFVGIPLLWGVNETLFNAMKLFR